MALTRHRLPRPLLLAAVLPYRAAGRFAWHFARGKLSGDPVFAGLLAHGWIAPRARVLDLGCGQGLLASMLLACEQPLVQKAWPSGWPAAPVGCTIHGLELMPRDVARAQKALAAHADRAMVQQGDITTHAYPAADAVVILDVLHYLPSAAQLAVLQKAEQALRPGGRLLLRVGDRAAGWPHRISNGVDKIVSLLRGHASTALCSHPLQEWKSRLLALGFQVTAWPMDSGTPFSGILLVADKGTGIPLQEA